MLEWGYVYFHSVWYIVICLAFVLFCSDKRGKIQKDSNDQIPKQTYMSWGSRAQDSPFERPLVSLSENPHMSNILGVSCHVFSISLTSSYFTWTTIDWQLACMEITEPYFENDWSLTVWHSRDIACEFSVTPLWQKPSHISPSSVIPSTIIVEINHTHKHSSANTSRKNLQWLQRRSNWSESMSNTFSLIENTMKMKIQTLIVQLKKGRDRLAN